MEVNSTYCSSTEIIRAYEPQRLNSNDSLSINEIETYGIKTKYNYSKNYFMINAKPQQKKKKHNLHIKNELFSKKNHYKSLT